MAAPKRELFKAADVCEVAEVQPFVLRSWEAEFPKLGQTPVGGGPRVYRRPDIDLVLKIKSLVFGEGLTLAGARRRLEEGEGVVETPALSLDEVLGARARERVRLVRQGLHDLLAILSAEPRQELRLVPPPVPVRGGGRSRGKAGAASHAGGGR
jgi:DNA-binding transcriptional MerR regulator